MDSNTHSTSTPDGLTALAAAVDRLAAQDLDGLSDAVRAERVLVLRRLLDRLEGHWLNELAAVDARGAAGAEEGVQVGSTAGWLRTRLRMAPAPPAVGFVPPGPVRWPLTQTATALTDGELSAAHASVLAHRCQTTAWARGPYRRWQDGQKVVPRPPRVTLRRGLAQRGQGRPAWP